MTDKKLEKLFKQAAKTAMILWRNGDSEGFEDLAQDLWVFVLTPGNESTVKIIADACDNEVVAILKNIAQQLLSKQQHELNVYREKVMYSSNNVKDALKGKSTNKYIVDVIAEAMKKLEKQHTPYADAIASRYYLNVIPKIDREKNCLKNAHKALTQIVNDICISPTHRDSNDKLTVKDGPGSREGKFPQDSTSESGAQATTRRGKGGHSDPTANQALSILKHPEMEKELHQQDPITEYTKSPRQVLFLPDGRRYRMSHEEQRRVSRDPTAVLDVIDEVLERMC